MDYISKINDFLKSNEYYSLLIEGEWGAGKTYLWKYIQDEHKKLNTQENVFQNFIDDCKNEISLKNHFKSLMKFMCNTAAKLISWLCCYCGFCNKKNKEKSKKFVYISLFDKEHYKQVLEEVLLKSYTRHRILSFIKKITPYGVSIGSILSLLTKDDLKDVIICFDDIERKSDTLKIKDFLGLVLQLKDEKQCKVVLLSNTNELRKFEQTIFDNYKEKIIDLIIELKDRSEVIKEILGEKLKDIDIDLIPNNVDNIVNLRNLNKVIKGFEIFNNELDLPNLSKKTDDYKEIIKYLFECIMDVVYEKSEPKKIPIGYTLSENSRDDIRTIVEKSWKNYEFIITQIHKDAFDGEIKKHKIYRIIMKLRDICKNLINGKPINDFIEKYERNIKFIDKNEIQDFAGIMLYEFVDFMALIKVINSKDIKVKDIEKEIRRYILQKYIRIDGATNQAINLICDGDKDLLDEVKKSMESKTKNEQTNDSTWASISNKPANQKPTIRISSYNDFLTHLNDLKSENKYTNDEIETFLKNKIIRFYVNYFLKHPKNERNFKSEYARLYEIWQKLN